MDMEDIGSEVSQKIKAAIKAKLVELGAYVDDELPDYIMVMVANKRTRSQMDEDLQLFLSSKTKIFTTWLHTVLQKLDEVTVATFDKKQVKAKKSKPKKSGYEDDKESRKSSEDRGEKVKKHKKKEKETKKAKKNKHKNKEKVKLRSKKKYEKDESREKSKSGEDKHETKASQEGDSGTAKHKKSKDKTPLSIIKKAIIRDLEKNEKLKHSKSESSSQSSSSSESFVNTVEKEKKDAKNDSKTSVQLNEDVVNKKLDNESEGEKVENSKKNKKALIEDEFNIEPLEPEKKSSDKESVKSQESVIHIDKPETTISAPTEELLKQHDKLQNQKFNTDKKMSAEKNENYDSEDSLSPEEMRRQLLLNRAKKKLEESKLAERMKSNSPEVVMKETNKSGERNRESRSGLPKQAEVRFGKTSPPLHSPVRSGHSSRGGSPNHRSRRFSMNSFSSDHRHQSPSRKINADWKSKQRIDKIYAEDKGKTISREERDTSPRRHNKSRDDERERKRGITTITENLEIGKKSKLRKESDSRKEEKEEKDSRKPVPSRVVTITGPEAPEIPSVVQVKPRQFVAKEKQANRNLILKAVAEAEKSIATSHPRPEIKPEMKKREGLFTKDLRGKRFQKLEVTVSKFANSDSYRRISIDSAGKSEKSRSKHHISEMGNSHRKSDRNTSRSEDQFISSKTSGMEKNDKYIRCWLEGVEKAVKEDVMIDPNKMEEFVRSTDEEKEHIDEEHSKSEDTRKRKKLKSGESSEDQCNKNPKKFDSPCDEPTQQIVVTLDGLDSKTLKEIISKSKEGFSGPHLSRQKDKSEKITQKPLELANEKTTSNSKNLTSCGKISDRFGKLNPVSDVKESEKQKTSGKSSANQSSEREKKESKNRELIARLSEKFGKVDRQFESKKRKYPEEDRRYPYESGRSQKEEYEKNGKLKKSEKRFSRDESDYKNVRMTKSRDRIKF